MNAKQSNITSSSYDTSNLVDSLLGHSPPGWGVESPTLPKDAFPEHKLAQEVVSNAMLYKGFVPSALALVQTLPSCLFLESMFPCYPQRPVKSQPGSKHVCSSCPLIWYIAGKIVPSCKVSYWNFGTDVPSVFLIVHSLVGCHFAGLPIARQTHNETYSDLFKRNIHAWIRAET